MLADPDPNPEARTVLLVEDEPLARKWFVRSFNNEFRMLAADGVASALAMLQAHGDEIAVVLTDYRLPGRTGMDLLRDVQRSYRHLVPMLYTAYADKDMTIAAINEGRVFRILEKPLDLDATRQALRDALALYGVQAREHMLHVQRVTAMRDTLGFLAHELNTPLATVRGYMGVLRDRYQPSVPDVPHNGHVRFAEHRAGELIAAIDSADRRAEYCQSLVNTFVHSAREAHAHRRNDAVEAGALVRSLLDSYPFEADERDWVACRVHEDFTLPGRRDLLYLVLGTLTKNALQALRGTKSPRLLIEVGRKQLSDRPARPWLRLTDNGPGIAPEVLPLLSREPFTTRASAGGHGMGLVFCRRVLQSIGGAFDIQSEPGRGTAILLQFPELDETRP